MKKTIAVVNLKGGVGKTTTAVNIAACWGELGKKVLLVDLDPQGSASMSYGIQEDGTNLLEALRMNNPLPVVPTSLSEVDIVPSGPALARANEIFIGRHYDETLSRCLSRTTGDWDLVIIDCPPSFGAMTRNALMASSTVVVPVEASFLGLHGLKQMIASIDSMKEQNPALSIEAIIPCRAHKRRRIHWDIMDRFRAMFPGKVAPIVRENVALAEAPGKGKPVILTARLSKGADDYRFVTLWLSERIGDKPRDEYLLADSTEALTNIA
jgi:chromosome partitioning protein